MPACPCNVFNVVASGGFTLGGSTTITDSIVSGGFVLGGSATVTKVGVTYDGLIAVYPLDESTGQFLDRGPYALHGTSGAIRPTLDTGVFCLPSSKFEEDDSFNGASINLPIDPMGPSQQFSVSCWVKLNSFYKQRTLYARGYEDLSGNTWTFTLGYSVANHLVATVQLSDGTEYSAFGSILENDRFYHVAVECKTGQEIDVYVNGSFAGYIDLPALDLMPLANGSYFGRHGVGSYPTCNLQEFRIYPGCPGQAYWQAERDNLCSPAFFSIGAEETPSLS